MTTSTIELMRATARAERSGNAAAAHLRRLMEAEVAERGTTTEPPGTIHTDDGITIIPDPGERITVPPGTRFSAEVIGERHHLGLDRLRPMHPQSVPAGVTRSLRHLTLLRRRPQDPETFHRFNAAATVCDLRELVDLRGARALDIGGQAGFTADALRDEGATCLVVEQPCQLLDPHDGRLDRVMRADGDALPFADRSFDVVHSTEALCQVGTPQRMLDEIARILVPGTGVAHLVFTNRRSPLARFVPEVRQRGVSIGEVLGWSLRRHDIEVLTADSRYLPAWANRVVGVPGVREVATGSLRLVFRVRS